EASKTLESSVAKERDGPCPPQTIRSTPNSLTAKSTEPECGSAPANSKKTFSYGLMAFVPSSQSPPACPHISATSGKRCAKVATFIGVDSPDRFPPPGYDGSPPIFIHVWI